MVIKIRYLLNGGDGGGVVGGRGGFGVTHGVVMNRRRRSLWRREFASIVSIVDRYGNVERWGGSMGVY